MDGNGYRGSRHRSGTCVVSFFALELNHVSDAGCEPAHHARAVFLAAVGRERETEEHAVDEELHLGLGFVDHGVCVIPISLGRLPIRTSTGGVSTGGTPAGREEVMVSVGTFWNGTMSSALKSTRSTDCWI